MDPVKLKKEELSYNQIKAFIYAIWILWAANCFINTIIFLNLLVAEVNNTYQKIMTESEVLDISVMAELNFMYNKYWRMYRWSQFFLNDFIRNTKSKQFDVLLFARPLKDITGKAKSFTTLIMQSVK